MLILPPQYQPGSLWSPKLSITRVLDWEKIVEKGKIKIKNKHTNPIIPFFNILPPNKFSIQKNKMLFDESHPFDG
jgi:hypothetical protein